MSNCPRCGVDLDYCECFREPEPTWTVEDECEGNGHPYAGDDGSGPDAGRCYCDKRSYPTGGPK